MKTERGKPEMLRSDEESRRDYYRQAGGGAFPEPGDTDAWNARFAEVLSTYQPPKTPLTGPLRRLGAHLDRLATSVLLALRLEGALRWLSGPRHLRQEQKQAPCRSAEAQQKDPSRKG